MEYECEPDKNQEFAVHMLNEDGKVKARQIQQHFDILLNALKTICTDGRSFSVTKTKLEEACFFAKKAMAINLGNQAEQ
jgi:hypothetical protein